METILDKISVRLFDYGVLGLVCLGLGFIVWFGIKEILKEQKNMTSEIKDINTNLLVILESVKLQIKIQEEQIKRYIDIFERQLLK